MKIYTNDDVSPDSLKGERIAIIGYGSQGRAHAQNLKDSGADVVVGLRAGGAGEQKAKADGLTVLSVADACKDATIIAVLTPDMTHAELYKEQIEPNAPKGVAILFAHGFSVLYGRVVPRAARASQTAPMSSVAKMASMVSSWRMTIMSQARTWPRPMPSIVSAIDEKTRAGPSNASSVKPSSRATQPSGARVPCRMAKPPCVGCEVIWRKKGLCAVTVKSLVLVRSLGRFLRKVESEIDVMKNPARLRSGRTLDPRKRGR